MNTLTPLMNYSSRVNYFNSKSNHKQSNQISFKGSGTGGMGLGIVIGGLFVMFLDATASSDKVDINKEAKEYVMQVDKGKAGELLLEQETGKTINWVDVADSIKTAQDSVRIYEKGRAAGYAEGVKSAGE